MTFQSLSAISQFYYILQTSDSIFSNFCTQRHIMIENLQLPPLDQLKEIMYTCNTKKCFAYLLYFAKTQITVRKFFESNNKKMQALQNVPIENQRCEITKVLTQILSLNYKQVSLQSSQLKEMEFYIISAQKIIMGLILIGHVHVFEIMIKSFMPLFLDILKGKINYQSSQRQLAKKIAHFCRETICILALWFPKSFYHPQSPSWFKKTVQLHNLQCPFLVYFTNQKIAQYEALLKQLKLSETSQQCLQCLFCINNLETTDEEGMPALPSIIPEESSIINSYSGKKRVSKISPSQLQLQSIQPQQENQQFLLSNHPKGSFVISSKQQFPREQKRQLLNVKRSMEEHNNRQKSQKSEINKKYDSKINNNSSKLSMQSNSRKSMISEKIRKHRQERERRSQISLQKLENSSCLSGKRKDQSHSNNQKNGTYSEYFVVNQKQVPTKNSYNGNFQYDGSKNSRFLQKLCKYRQNKKKTAQSLKHANYQENKLTKQVVNEQKDKLEQEENKSIPKFQNGRKGERGLSFAKKLREQRSKQKKNKRQIQNKPENISSPQRNRPTASPIEIEQSKYATYNSIDSNSMRNPVNPPETPYFQKEKNQKQSHSFHISPPNEQALKQTNYPKTSKEFNFQSVFHNSLFRNDLLHISKLAFRKQCIKINKKKIFGESDKWILEIKTHVKNEYELEVKYQITGYQYKDDKYNGLVAPIDSKIVCEDSKQYLRLNFKECFRPIVIKICEHNTLLPISIVSMLKTIDLGIEESEFKKKCGGFEEIAFELDPSLFGSVQQVANKIRLHKNQTSTGFSRFYSFYSSLLYLRIVQTDSKVPRYGTASTYSETIEKYYTADQKNENRKLAKIDAYFMKKQISQQVQCLLFELKKGLGRHQKHSINHIKTMVQLN